MTATSNSNIISPALVQRLAAVKCEIDAEAAALVLYKENNREEDTLNVCKDAIAKLKAMEVNSIPAEQQADQ